MGKFAANSGPIIFFLILTSFLKNSVSQCSRGCDLAYGSCYVSRGWNLTYMAQLFSTTVNDIFQYNNQTISNPNNVPAGIRLNVRFSCNCINGSYLGHSFPYTITPNDTYSGIAGNIYANLTTSDWLQETNTYAATQLPINAVINVVVNCSCGDSNVSKDYGLFVTYPLRQGDNLSSVAASQNFQDLDLLQKYNPGVDFSSGVGRVIVPARDLNGSYRPLSSSVGISAGGIAGISISAAVVLLSAVWLYLWISRRKKLKQESLIGEKASDNSVGQGRHAVDLSGSLARNSENNALPSVGFASLTVDKSVEFSYKELASATDDFSIANKIGEGGYGSVYYAELRGEKAAIKKMDMQASRAFLSELKVLTHVHHVNLVRLIGYCTEGSLFLVYEFIENDNLGQHLHGVGRESLPWPVRVRIALDSSRGLEYIHEHTVPVYVHRDIKSANILIDKNFRAKVADFGLTKLVEVGKTSTNVAGTFGYMPPEYVLYGDVSAKMDVYAFGVVLYELVSGKTAIVRTNVAGAEAKGLVALFEDAFNQQPDPLVGLRKLVDPCLGETYPMDSVYKMAQLAKACTHENPQLRPSMRSVAVALMTLSSSTEEWDVGSFYENQALVNLMSGR